MQLVKEQPAYKIYAFERGWRVIGYVIQHLFPLTNDAARWWFRKASEVLQWGKFRRQLSKGWFGNIQLYIAFIVMIGMGIAGGFQYVSAMLLAAIFVVIQTTLLVIWAAISFLAMGVLALCTFVYSRFYHVFFRCPYCHSQMDIPVFICPECGTEHTRLWPSIYGITSHRCLECGKKNPKIVTKLPTLSFKLPGTVYERDKLQRICANEECKAQLHAGIGSGTNVHVPIIGGPSTGKSHYITMATREFIQRYGQTYHYQITFTDDKQKLNYDESIRQLDTGHKLVKTALNVDNVAHAYNLKIKAPRKFVPKIAYIYDMAGEIFFSGHDVEKQKYYEYVDGIIFVIDPFSIPDYKYAHQTEISAQQTLIAPGDLDIMQTYERMFQMFEASMGMGKNKNGKTYPQPISIVVTKTDALNLEQEIGAEAARQLMQADPTLNEEEAIHNLVRNFLLKNNLDNFVRDVELQFKNVRYFSCSALGRSPEANDTRAFVPMRVADPFIWLLSSAKTIKGPATQKVKAGGKTATLPPVMPPIEIHQHTPSPTASQL